jgi:peptidoglycan hydrolase-like amidase
MLVSIAVFVLFHTTELWVRPASSQPILVEVGSAAFMLDGSRVAKFHLGQTGPVRVMSDFQLSIPGKIERRFRGVLHITPSERELVATIDMDLEDAVAAVVAAESGPGATVEALKAQAVAARSFYTASNARHHDYAFCDTTHCQFLRSIPARGTPARQASDATRGLILAYQNRPFAPFYSAVCGGHTRALGNTTGYPYFAVDCTYCQRNPTQPIRGHRLGMCQSGAAGLASNGASFRTILNHYYPATTIMQTPSLP